jgi:hypothetical protein
MFLLDDLLLLPAKGMMAIFREIQKSAQQEVGNEGETVRAELCDLYLLLETRQITEEEFDVRERKLLDRLDTIAARNVPAENEADDEETMEDDDAEIKSHELAVGDVASKIVSGKRSDRAPKGGVREPAVIPGR